MRTGQSTGALARSSHAQHQHKGRGGRQKLQLQYDEDMSILGLLGVEFFLRMGHLPEASGVRVGRLRWN